MVTIVVEKVRDCLKNRSEIIHLGYEEGKTFEGILEEFLDTWESSDKNTFNVANSESSELTSELRKFLGVQQKKRVFTHVFVHNWTDLSQFLCENYVKKCPFHPPNVTCQLMDR